ncbi:MAG: tRNA lysidine(34) synthetase TilS [Chitinophagaceae bacterium]
MLQRFIRFFKQLHLLDSPKFFIAAVSGGVDSVVLVELCKQAGLNFCIAHCNFGLRGEESLHDEFFVKSHGKKYSVEVHVKRFDTKQSALEKKTSIQETARDLRYNWFEELRGELSANYILTAHHANDNIETVLMNFFRGTGLHGLTGMRDLQAYTLRPLLQFNREEIEQFAKEHKLEWVEDSSNQSNKYTRNFFRNELLPAIKKVYPQVEENLLDNIERLKKTELLYQRLVSDYKEKVFKPNASDGVQIPVKLLQKNIHTALIYEIIKNYGFTEKQVPEVIKLLESESGRYIENEYYRIIRHRHWLIIASTRVQFDAVPIEKNTKRISFDYSNQLSIEFIVKEHFRLQSSNHIAQLDASGIEFPLLLRKWKEGDYFYPLGMRKKKKLSRFFIDAKLSKVDKENTWIIESGKRIIWVVNHRVDDRFKVTESTKTILQLTASIP